MSIAAKFKKSERICSKQEFSTVLNSRNAITIKPLKLYWAYTQKNETAELGLAKLGVSVPKRLFAKAHERNKIKRRIKEAYRINKNRFIYEHLKNNAELLVLVVYTSKEILSFKEIEKQLVKGLSEIVKKT